MQELQREVFGQGDAAVWREITRRRALRLCQKMGWHLLGEVAANISYIRAAADQKSEGKVKGFGPKSLAHVEGVLRHHGLIE